MAISQIETSPGIEMLVEDGYARLGRTLQQGIWTDEDQK